MVVILPLTLQLFGCEKSEPTIPEDAVIARRIDKAMIDADDIPQIYPYYPVPPDHVQK